MTSFLRINTIATVARTLSSARYMSNSTPTLHKYVVYAPDKTDEGALARRMSVRPKHLAGASNLHDTGMLSDSAIYVSNFIVI